MFSEENGTLFSALSFFDSLQYVSNFYILLYIGVLKQNNMLCIKKYFNGSCKNYENI